MRPILLVLLATCALLALCGWAIGKGDRRTFAAGPDVAAENFMEALLLRRGKPAHAHLSESIAWVTADSLVALGRAIKDRRSARNAESSIKSMGRAGSEVRVEVHFDDGGTSELDLPLVWERGRWRVGALQPIETWTSLLPRAID